MQPRRIILANDRSMTREMLRRVLDKVPELSVMREVNDLSRLPTAVEETKAGWVVISLPDDGLIPQAAKNLLDTGHNLRILGLSGDGSRIKVAWIEYHEQELGQLDLSGLIGILSSSEDPIDGSGVQDEQQ